MEEEVARTDGGTSIIETHKDTAASRECPRSTVIAGIRLLMRIGNGARRELVAADGWKILTKIVQRRTRLLLLASGGVGPLLPVIHAGRTARAPRPMPPEEDGLWSILGPATGAADGSEAATRAVTSLGRGWYLRFSG